MNQDLYLQRLKSIREKYSSASKAAPQAKNNHYVYRPHPANPEQTMLRQKLEGTPTRTRPAQFEQPRTPFTPATRVQRSYSLANHTPVNVTENPSCDPSQKRMENFSAFIRDLDQRIEEKERALNSRIRPGDTWKHREKEDVEYDVVRTINRYSSFKDIKTSNNPENFSRVIPREAYQRNLAKRQEVQSRRGISSLEIQNVVQRKWAQEGVAHEKLRLMGAHKNDKLKINQYASPLGVSTQENIVLHDNWSIGKLDSIQKRIKAVLG